MVVIVAASDASVRRQVSSSKKREKIGQRETHRDSMTAEHEPKTKVPKKVKVTHDDLTGLNRKL